VIKDFRWQPTRVVNAKVYDGTLSFVAEDADSPVSEAHLEFNPVYPPEIPREAIPEENRRPYDFAAWGKSEIFSQTITDLKGGKQYSAIAKANDQAGNGISSSLGIPYVREYENIAAKDDVLVGAAYYLWHGKDGRHWDKIKGTPLLGNYDSTDPFVISKHIDWATGHGIDFFHVSWWGPSSYEDRALRNLTTNPQAKDIKFMILYESLGRLEGEGSQFSQTIDMDNVTNVRVLGDDIEYIAKTYFPHASYLRLNGNPVLYLWWSIVYQGDVKSALRSIRKRVSDVGYDLYLIGDPILFNEPKDAAIIPYDGITQWTNYSWDTNVLNNLEVEVDRTYSKWSRAAKRLNVDFIPSALPGFQRIPNPEWPVLSKTPERFEKQLGIARKYMSEQIRAIMIPTFNDWHEHTYVEPSFEDGFTYLKTLKKSLT
jgi:hypothetical protein